jgi:predicted DCC family thiol-disulfide oxidoreductase YuxK
VTHGGAAALSELLQTSRARRWNLASSFLAAPGVARLAAAAYRLVARNRHRMPGAGKACSLHLSSEE